MLIEKRCIVGNNNHEKKYLQIKPNYIKDNKGKTLEILLSIDEYNSILKTADSLAQLKKGFKKKK